MASAEARNTLESGLQALEFVGEDWVEDPSVEIIGPLRSTVLAVGQSLGGLVPAIVGSVVGTTLDAIIYVFAVVSLYLEGPPRSSRAYAALADGRPPTKSGCSSCSASFRTTWSSARSPPPRFRARWRAWASRSRRHRAGHLLLDSHRGHVVLPGGWHRRGVGPAGDLRRGCRWRVGTAAFLGAWSIGLTGTVDNLVRPLFLRGHPRDIHPLLIFLAVLGGISWMGFPGALGGAGRRCRVSRTVYDLPRGFPGVVPRPDPSPRPNPGGRVLGSDRRCRGFDSWMERWYLHGSSRTLLYGESLKFRGWVIRCRCRRSRVGVGRIVRHVVIDLGLQFLAGADPAAPRRVPRTEQSTAWRHPSPARESRRLRCGDCPQTARSTRRSTSSVSTQFSQVARGPTGAWQLT